MNDIFFMQEALKEAKKAEALMEIPVGAVIVKDNKIIARGYNRKETDKNALCHAEIMSINQACSILSGWRLIGCTMYVTLEPCAMCAGALVNSRIERLVIGTCDEKTGACGTVMNITDNPVLNHQINVSFGVCEDECREILQDFFKRLRFIRKENGYK